MNKNVAELDSDFIVLAIPKRTIEVEINAKAWIDGEVVEVKRTMDFEEVREMFAEAANGYIPTDAVFTLSPNYGKSKLEALVDSYLSRVQEDEEE